MKNIAIFCSGNGSNFQAIINAKNKGKIKAEISLMVCDNPKAFALVRANKAKIPVALLELKKFKNKLDFDKAIIAILKKQKIDLVVLAGYMKMLSPAFIRAYKNRILNIHPALLPSFKGTRAVKDALTYGVKVTGVTVHFADEKMDHGPIILQESLTIKPKDTEATLAKKIHTIEHKLYPQAIQLALSGRLKVKNRQVIIS